MPRQKILQRDVDKLLVEERKKMRVAQKESKFKRNTLTIYRHQTERAKDLGLSFDYTLEDLRDVVREQLETGTCYYCGNKMTLTTLAADHKTPVARGGAFSLMNTAICHKSCNFQKGKLNEEEFDRLNEFLATLDPEIARDVRARLSSGGKWVGKG